MSSSNLRTSPTGSSSSGGGQRGLSFGANGPATLRGMTEALHHEAPSVIRTAYTILTTSGSTSATTSRFAALPSVRSVTSGAYSTELSPASGVAGLQYRSGGTPPRCLAPLVVACVDALGIIVDSFAAGSPSPRSAPASSSSSSAVNVSSLADGSAGSVATLEIISALVRVVLLQILSDNPHPLNEADGGAVQRANGGGSRGGGRDAGKTSSHVDPVTHGTKSAAAGVVSASAMVATLVRVVVAFSTLGQLAVTTPRHLSAAAAMNQSAKIAEQEVRALSLFLVVGLVMQHADILTDAQSCVLPTLLPPVTSVDALLTSKFGTSNGASLLRFPLLSPLLHDRIHRVRNAASIAICQLLHRLQPRLGLCAEPGPRDSKSFTSLSTGLGVIVRDLHAVMLRALTSVSKLSSSLAGASHSGASGHHNALPAYAHNIGGTAASAPGLLNIVSALVLVTPYSRCPSSQQFMVQLLQLPLVGDILSQPPQQQSSIDVSAICSLLSSAWRAKAFQDVLLGSDTTGGSTKAPSTSAALPPAIMVRYVDQLASLMAAVTTMTPTSLTSPVAVVSASFPSRKLSTSPPVVGGEHVASGVNKLSQVLDAMRALTHAARSFPQFVSPSSVELIIRTSHQLVVADASTDGGLDVMLLSEMLRLLMHVCGLAWEAFGPAAYGATKNANAGGATEAASGAPDNDGATDLLGMTPLAKLHASAASLLQREHVLLSIYCPLFVKPSTCPAVKCLIYKCLGQIGDDVLALCAPTSAAWRSAFAAIVSDTSHRQGLSGFDAAAFMITVLRRGASEVDVACRAEALQTGGLWALKYPRSISGATSRNSIAALSQEQPTEVASPLVLTADLVAALTAFAHVARGRLTDDPDDDVRSKALFLLSNICAVCGQVAEDNEQVRRSHHAPPRHHAEHHTIQVQQALTTLIQELCIITLNAVDAAYQLRATAGLHSQSPASLIAGQAVRMMQYLLKALEPDCLIDELPGHPEGVASCYLDFLQRFLRCPASANLFINDEPPARGATTEAATSAPPVSATDNGASGLMGRVASSVTADSMPAAARTTVTTSKSSHCLWDIKSRWNAAFALGEVLSVPHVYAADPPAARVCVQTLLIAIGLDSNYKVRTRAAVALTKLIRHVVDLSSRRWAIQVESKAHNNPISSNPATSSLPSRRPPTLFSPEEDVFRSDMERVIPEALDALCSALMPTPTNAAIAPAPTLAPPPFREVKPFTDAVRSAIEVLLAAAPSTDAFQTVLSKHKQLLQDKQLL